MSTVDANRVILTGENSVIRLNNNDSDAFTTNATFWRVLSAWTSLFFLSPTLRPEGHSVDGLSETVKPWAKPPSPGPDWSGRR